MARRGPQPGLGRSLRERDLGRGRRTARPTRPEAGGLPPPTPRRRSDQRDGLRERRVHQLHRSPELQHQLGGWADDGLRAVKMKIGSAPVDDLERVRAARDAIGPDVQLFVDANGAYNRKQALGFAERFDDEDVTWFEEPVSSDDLAGLRLLRDRGPAGMQIAAGEYGYTPPYFCDHARRRRGRHPASRRDPLRRRHRLPPRIHPGPSGRHTAERAHRPGHPCDARGRAGRTSCTSSTSTTTRRSRQRSSTVAPHCRVETFRFFALRPATV